MSTCSRRCDDSKSIFTFSQRPATFQKAQIYCKQNGGTLARNLNASLYAKLLKCCSGNQLSYWIGLQNVGGSKCTNTNSPGFQWIGSRTCSDGSPLNIEGRHINNEECVAVTMQTRPSDTNRNMPFTRVEYCNTNNIYYICQTAKQNRNPKETTTTTTMKQSTKTSTISREDNKSVTNIKTATLNGSTSNKTEIFTTSPSEKTGSNSVSNVWITFGLLAVFSIFLFLAVFFLCRRQNKRFLFKKINCFHVKKDKKDVIDETYNEWV